MWGGLRCGDCVAMRKHVFFRRARRNWNEAQKDMRLIRINAEIGYELCRFFKILHEGTDLWAQSESERDRVEHASYIDELYQ